MRRDSTSRPRRHLVILTVAALCCIGSSLAWSSAVTRNKTRSVVLSMSSNSNDQKYFNINDPENSLPGRQRFLEESARQGANKIAKLSIQERTQRAMLAEAVEDRMILLEEELVNVVKTNTEHEHDQYQQYLHEQEDHDESNVAHEPSKSDVYNDINYSEYSPDDTLKISPKAKELVQEIKALRDQYNSLVNGKPSPIIDTMDGLSGSNSGSTTETSGNRKGDNNKKQTE